MPNDNGYSKAKAIYETINSTKSRARDQLFQNLESSILEVEELVPYCDFDLRALKVKQVLIYLSDLGELAELNGIKLPNMKRFNPQDITRLEGYHGRVQLHQQISFVKTQLVRVEGAINFLEPFYGSLKDLVYGDPEIPADMRDRLASREKPLAYNRVFHVQKEDFNQFYDKLDDILEEPKETSQRIRKVDRVSGALVKISEPTVALYVKAYFNVEATACQVFQKQKEGKAILVELEDELSRIGGALNGDENTEYVSFISGRHYIYSTASYKLILDGIRFLAEERLNRTGS